MYDSSSSTSHVRQHGPIACVCLSPRSSKVSA